MTTPIRPRNSAVLAKIETTEGVDAAPVPGSDAVLVENPQVRFETSTEQTNEATGTLDPTAPIPSGTKVRVTFDVLLKGSGSVGVAPEFGKLLKACSMAEVITSAAVPVAPEAAAAGSTSSVTLGAGASATAQIYRGMPVQITGTPAPANGIYPVADYSASKVATLAALAGAAIAGTSSYQLLPNVLYKPASSDPPSLTFYVYKDKKLTKVFGARGTATLKLTSGKAGRITFEFTGMYGGQSDDAVPAGLVYDSTRPAIWKAGRALIQRKIAAMATLSVQLGNTLTQPANPNSAEGFDPAVITARNITGTCDPLEELVATRDSVSLMRTGTPQVVLADYGTVAGNRTALTIPAAQVTQKDDSDREGLATEGLTFACTGQDAGIFLCFY